MNRINTGSQSNLLYYNPNTYEISHDNYLLLTEQVFSGLNGPSIGIYKDGANSIGFSTGSIKRFSIGETFCTFENNLRQKLQPILNYTYIDTPGTTFNITANNGTYTYIIATSGVNIYLPNLLNGNTSDSGACYRIINNVAGNTLHCANEGPNVVQIMYPGGSGTSDVTLSVGVYEIFAVKGTVTSDGWIIFKSSH